MFTIALDIALFIFLCVGAVRVGAALRRERATWREYGQGSVLQLLLPLFPLAYVFSWIGAFWLPTVLVWALALLCYLPAWAIARKQREVFERSGTSLTQAAAEAAGDVGGLALVGMVVLALRIGFAVTVALFRANA